MKRAGRSLVALGHVRVLGLFVRVAGSVGFSIVIGDRGVGRSWGRLCFKLGRGSRVGWDSQGQRYVYVQYSTAR